MKNAAFIAVGKTNHDESAKSLTSQTDGFSQNGSPVTYVPQLNLERMQATLDRQVKRIGVQAVWRSASGDRWCWAFFSEWNPREMMARLIEPMDRRVLVSALGFSIPLFRVERLVTFVQPFDQNNPVEWEELQLFEPPRRLNPNGLPLCWDCRCRQ